MKKSILVLLLALLGLTSIYLSPTSKSPTKPVALNKQEDIYVVKKGETLTEIAEVKYGNAEYWTNLWNDNQHIINPSIIEPGVKLTIADKKPVKIEEIEKKLMTRLLNSPSNTPISPGLAFETAGKEVIAQAVKPVYSSSIATVAPSSASTTGSFGEIYKQAGEKYGIPWQILYGLHLTETGLRDGEIYNGYGSGAQGPMQFMPGTWKAYGVDGNGDGLADINNAVDAIHGAANYLVKHGGIEQGLYYYGGNTSGTLKAACDMGYCL